MNWNQLTQTIISYKIAYKNYLKVLFELGKKRKASHNQNINIKVLLRNGIKLIVPYTWVTTYANIIGLQNRITNKNISGLNLSEKGISFKYKGHSVIIDPAKFSDLYAVFFNEEYSYLDVIGKDVIDVGMNIGDSSIYFAINGANRVIGMEPYPYAFSFAQKNIKLNNIRNIILLNAGYGKDGSIIVSEEVSTNSSSLIPSSKGKEIPIISLKTLVNQYNLKNFVLKIDCEGCEYALLNENNEIFQCIEMIQIEYHYGYENIVNKLKSVGFDVRFTEPRNSYNPDAINPIMYLGYIYGQRQK